MELQILIHLIENIFDIPTYLHKKSGIKSFKTVDYSLKRNYHHQNSIYLHKITLFPSNF